MRSLDHDGQRPICYSPWQTGTELYEAYGRFLDRMRDGTMPEGDCGWCDGGILPCSAPSSSYDANLCYSEEAADAYLAAQELKHAKSQKIAEKAIQQYQNVKTFRALREARITELRRRIVQILGIVQSISFSELPAKWRAREELHEAWKRLKRVGEIIRSDTGNAMLNRKKARFSLASKLSETSTS